MTITLEEWNMVVVEEEGKQASKLSRQVFANIF